MPTTLPIDQQQQRVQHLFIVRLWQETDAVTESMQWRGSVKHVLTEQNHYFTHLPDLLAFISTIAQPSSSAAAAEQQTLGAPACSFSPQLQPEQRQQHTDKDHHSGAPETKG